MLNKNGYLCHWPDWRNFFLIIWLVFLSFFPVLNAQFLYWDDDAHILENPLVTSQNSTNLPAIFHSVVNKTYIPLTVLSWNIENRLFGLNPFVFHLNNLLLHIAICLLIYLLGRRLNLSTTSCLIASLLFGLHPMHVESVAWITARKDVLYSLFFLSGLWFYIRYILNNDRRALALCVVAGYLSLLTKPMALSFPLILLVLDWFYKRPLNPRLIVEKIPFVFFIPIVWLTYSLNILPSNSSFLPSVLLWIWSLTFYILKFFVPFNLSPLYATPYPISIENTVYSGSIFFIVIILFILIRFRTNRWLTFGALFYFFSIFMLLRTFDVAKSLGPSIVADRFMYLPSLGIIYWLSHTIGEILIKPQFKRLKMAVMITGLCALAFYTFQQSRLWQNDLTLWNRVIARHPSIALAYNSRAVALSKQGEKQQAIEDLNQALRIDGNFARAYFNRGKIFSEMGQHARAIEDFSKSIEKNAHHERSYLERGISYSKSEEWDKALKDFNAVLSLNPNHAGALNNRGIVELKMGNIQKAHGDFTRALEITPDLVPALLNRAKTWKDLNNEHEAFKDLEQARRLQSLN